MGLEIKNAWDTTSHVLSRAERWYLVDPSDTEDLPKGRPRAIVVQGGAGIVNIRDIEGNDMPMQISESMVGVERSYGVVRVLASGTTATGIYAIY